MRVRGVCVCVCVRVRVQGVEVVESVECVNFFPLMLRLPRRLVYVVKKAGLKRVTDSSFCVPLNFFSCFVFFCACVMYGFSSFLCMGLRQFSSQRFRSFTCFSF